MSEATPIPAAVREVLDLVEASTGAMLAGGPGAPGAPGGPGGAGRAAGAGAGWMDTDLTLGQLRFIHVLAGQGALSIGQVAGHLGVTLATASQFVDRLERPGYVERVHRSDDRRVVECRLTGRGLALVAAMRGMQRDGLAHLLGLLEPDELRDMARLFRVIGQRLEAASPSAPNSPPDAGITLEEVRTP